LHLAGTSSRLLLTTRGTYTTQAKGKKENRRSEILMREAEYAATMASLVDPDYTYPKKVSCLL
jgi:alpha-mannosidase